MDDSVQFDFPTNEQQKIIKVLGVGGGGCNAVNHMYREGIDGVTFLVCNTDKKVLDDSPVPHKLQLGQSGLGAGNNPAVGRKDAEESLDAIRSCLDDGTQMVFITAGMGGGTGTGAAPVIAQVAREMGILTVGIVTIPYQWEADRKIDQALDGVEEISKRVDALIVIKNDMLSKIYDDMTFEEAYDKADDIVLVAAKSIANIITMHGRINLDFNDVRTVLKDGGVAIIGTGYGQGEGRVTMAIQNALASPLLNDNEVFNARKVAFCISYSSKSKLMMSEMDEVSNFMMRFSRDIETKHGVEVDDETLGEQVKITILATGFGMQDIHIDELDQRLAARTQEEEERLQEEEERRRKRREQYYGTSISSPTARQRRRHIYLFSPEDLDCLAVIEAVEASPTYSRDKKTLEAIRHTAEQAVQQATEEAESLRLAQGGEIVF